MTPGRMTLKAYRAGRPKRSPLDEAARARLRTRVTDMLKAELPPGLVWTWLEPSVRRDLASGGAVGRSGWPDLLFILPGGRLGAIEISVGPRPCDSRRRWRADAAAAGALWAECRTAGGVRETLRGWGVSLPWRPR